jgi:hypothetical protein
MQTHRSGRGRQYGFAALAVSLLLAFGVVLFPAQGPREDAWSQQPAQSSPEQATQVARSDDPSSSAASVGSDIDATAPSFQMAEASPQTVSARFQAIHASPAVQPTDDASTETAAAGSAMGEGGGGVGPFVMATGGTIAPRSGVAAPDQPTLPNGGPIVSSNGPAISPGSAAAPATRSSPPTGNPSAGLPAGGVPPAQTPTSPPLAATPTNPAPPPQPSSPTTSLVGPPNTPAQPASTGAPASIGGPTSPNPAIPGQTPGNPTTPIGNGPNGSAILPIAGAGCSGSSCAGHPWQFFDPPVAIGYDYQLKPTAPNQSLTFGITGIMVTTSIGSGVYNLWLYDAVTGTYVDSRNFSSSGKTITIAADPSANPNGAFNVVQFLLSLTPQEDHELGITDPSLGLTQFSIRGIDPAAGLNPDDPNAFITGLLFAGDINGDLLITPLAVDSVTGLPVDPASFEVAIPEPGTIILFITALATLGLIGRRQKVPYRRGSS